MDKIQLKELLSVNNQLLKEAQKEIKRLKLIMRDLQKVNTDQKDLIGLIKTENDLLKKHLANKK